MTLKMNKRLLRNYTRFIGDRTDDKDREDFSRPRQKTSEVLACLPFLNRSSLSSLIFKKPLIWACMATCLYNIQYHMHTGL